MSRSMTLRPRRVHILTASISAALVSLTAQVEPNDDLALFYRACHVAVYGELLGDSAARDETSLHDAMVGSIRDYRAKEAEFCGFMVQKYLICTNEEMPYPRGFLAATYCFSGCSDFINGHLDRPTDNPELLFKPLSGTDAQLKWINELYTPECSLQGGGSDRTSSDPTWNSIDDDGRGSTSEELVIYSAPISLSGTAFLVRDDSTNSARTIKRIPKGTKVQVVGHRATGSGKFYITEWSYGRMQKGEAPNWIQVVEE